MSYVDDLVGRKPEIRPFSQYITNNLADNYCRGLNGKYATRLNEGIKAATQTADQLSRIIKGLIDDRITMNADTKVTTGDATKLSEEQQRALILALWSVRIPKINRDGKIDIENRAVYGNESYMPPVDLSETRSIPNFTPTFKPKHLYDLNEEKVKKVIEAIAGLRDDDNIPVKDIIDFIKSDADKMGISLSSNFEDEVRQIIKKIIKK